MTTQPNKNIEQAILSAVVFEPAILSYVGLKSDDFYYPFHKNLFKTFKALEAKNLPIDDEFIKNALIQNKIFDESEYLQILSASPITNVNAYVKTVKDATKSANFEREISLISNNKELSAIEKNEAIKQLSQKFELSSSSQKIGTLQDLIEEKIPVRPKYETGIKFLDDVFGGFELGQLITITGQQEVGKTQLANQILLNVARAHKALTFSLEFNKAKLQKYMLTKKHYNLKNIFAVTQDMVSGSIDEICAEIKESHKTNGTKFVTIDSQIMLFDDSQIFMSSENEITSIYRKLHNVANTLDIIIFIIATKSLSSTQNKGRGIEIFGSKKASHFADIQFDLSFENDDRDSKNEKRILWIGKNKQNGIHKEIELDFDTKNLEFMSTGESKAFEVVYEGGDEIPADEGISPEPPKEWKNSLDLFLS